MKSAIFPGSFDPVTNGHFDIIQRASKLFDKLIVSVAINESKHSLFTMKERQHFIRQVCNDKKLDNIEIVCFEGLLIDAVEKFNANAIVRGIRALSDFEIEFQMALMNRELNHHCETVFLMTSPEYSFVSSRMIKEIAKFGGDISSFVPPVIIDALKGRNLF